MPLLRLLLLLAFLAPLLTPPLLAEGLVPSKRKFFYQDDFGRMHSAVIVRRFRRVPIKRPPAKVDSSLDPRLFKAASIAQERANAKTKARCWQYVKQALLASGAISSYPRTNYAYQAGAELERSFGFVKISVRDPYAAPLGAVLVYGPYRNAPGHVEIRTRTGFVSDYKSRYRCKYPLIGVYAKKT